MRKLLIILILSAVLGDGRHGGTRGLLSGHCSTSTTFSIKSMQEMSQMRPQELECLYSAGVALGAIPRGFLGGNVLAIGSSKLLKNVFTSVWRGKFIAEGICYTAVAPQGTVGYIALNNVGKELIYPGYTYRGMISEEYHNVFNGTPPMEEHLLIDYTVAWPNLCQNFLFNGKLYEEVRLPQAFTNILDLVRAVGINENGDIILLGKSVQLKQRNLKSGRVAAYWATSIPPSSTLVERLSQPISPSYNFTFRRPNTINAILRWPTIIYSPTHSEGRRNRLLRRNSNKN